MHHFTTDHVFLLPHAEEYHQFYGISIEDVLGCLNDPDLHEGLVDDRFTAEKSVGDHALYAYYYRTLPLQAQLNEVYAIIDFVGYTGAEDKLAQRGELQKGTQAATKI